MQKFFNYVALLVMLFAGESVCMHRVLTNKANKRKVNLHWQKIEKKKSCFERLITKHKSHADSDKIVSNEPIRVEKGKPSEIKTLQVPVDISVQALSFRKPLSPSLKSTTLLFCWTIATILSNQRVNAAGYCCVNYDCGDCKVISQRYGMQLGTVIGGTIDGIPSEEWMVGRRQRTPQEEAVYAEEAREREIERLQRDREREQRQKERDQRQKERDEQQKQRNEREIDGKSHKTKCKGVVAKAIEWGNEPADENEAKMRAELEALLAPNIQAVVGLDCDYSDDSEVTSRRIGGTIDKVSSEEREQAGRQKTPEDKEAYAREQRVIMPSVEILTQRLKQLELEHFMAKSGIELIAGKKLTPQGVVVAIENALYDYDEYLEKTQTQRHSQAMHVLMQMRKPELLEILLRDNPEALQEAKAFYKQIEEE